MSIEGGVTIICAHAHNYQMDTNKDNQEIIEGSEKKVPVGEQSFHVGEIAKTPEKRELSQDDKIVSAELRREIEMMQLDDATKGEAEKKAQKIEFLGEKEKIEHLLQMAREKGVFFAVQVAKKMNEPYLLDILHDTLAQEGFYKKMGQVTDDDSSNDKT